MGKRKRDSKPQVDPAKLEKLIGRLERGELSDTDRQEVLRLLHVYLDLREKLSGSAPSVTQLRSFLGRRLKGPASSDDPES